MKESKENGFLIRVYFNLLFYDLEFKKLTGKQLIKLLNYYYFQERKSKAIEMCCVYVCVYMDLYLPLEFVFFIFFSVFNKV